jgi:hypothetical protein
VTVPAPARDGAARASLGGLPIPELRAYRARLRDEDDRVSYWRRLVHARLDLIRAGKDVGSTLSLDQVVRALGDTGGGARRAALHDVRAHDPLPDLPVLAQVWDAGAPVELLEAAAEQLSAYRTALHARIDEATAELVDRYRRQPALALSVLSP